MAGKLYSLIPRDELRERLSDPCCELEGDFLCFDELYEAAAEVLPKDFTIVDLGCYMAAQSYLFKDFKEYVGVDNYDVSAGSVHYIPPVRFKGAGNVRHLSMNIEDFLEGPAKEFDPERTAVLASYIPHYEEWLPKAKGIFPNLYWCYCNMCGFSGISSKTMKAEYLKLREAEFSSARR